MTNPISHKQAHNWLQLRLDGQLDLGQAAALEQHLNHCPTCQDFATRLAQLDRSLRHNYQARAQARPKLLRDSAITSMQEQMRLKMNQKRVMNFTTTLAFIAAMAALAVGLSWLVSKQPTAQPPLSSIDPAPAPTATPTTWTQDKPLSDPQQVIDKLETLAQQNIVTFQQEGWVHILRQDKGQQGDIPTTYSDGWFQFPAADAQTCLAGLEVVARELGGTPLQILVSRPDGASGDLLELRNGNGTVTYRQPGEDGCSLKPGFTLAGRLATRLKESLVNSTTPPDLQAWDEGRAGWVVTLTSPATSEVYGAGTLRETFHFESETGLLTQVIARTEWQEGALFSESAQVYVTEFIPTLPAQVAAQWKEFSGELQSYTSTP